MKRFIAALAALVWCLAISAAEKTVVWELPADWSNAVSYPAVEGYRAIVGENLMARGGTGAAVGDPDVPYYRVRLAFPTGGTFKGLTADVTWEPVDLGGALPIPVMQPVPTSEEPTLPAPGAAYKALYPSAPAIAGPVEKLDGAFYLPVTVSPFKWEGSEQKLYKAMKLVVTATFEVSMVRRAALSTLNPQLSTVSSGEVYYGDDKTADTIILTPPAFTNEWFKYAEFRKGFGNGIGHSFAIKSTAAIYKEYESVGGDDAFKIHRYLEDLYSLGKIKYIILGSAPKKYNYDPETMVPSRYVVVGSSLGQVLDEYYGCMDRNPFSGTVAQGVEVWDYDGDGAYMGHKNANGSYSCDSADKIDWTMEIAVMRVPLMVECVETSGSEKIVLHAADIMDNLIAKIKRLEDPNFPGRGGASFSGSTGFATSTYSKPSRPELYNSVVDERTFFDGSLNMFDPAHNSWSSDSEIVPRDRDWEFFSYYRGNNDDNIVIYNSSWNKSTYADMYNHDGDVFHILAHGCARGCAPGSGTSAFFATGLYAVYNCPIPCDSGMMDYCPSGSYGITNCICFGEAPVLSPNGGSLAAFNNTRLGWSATFAMSGNSGNGGLSHRMDWLTQRAMSGVATGTPMNAADALKYAKNNYTDNRPANAWGLAGAQVTGQGDPFTTYTKEYARTWKSDAANNNWSTNDANWTISGQTGAVVCDFSTDLYVDHTGKGSVTNTVINNLSSAGLFVKQDEGATFTLTGPMKYRATRETVITNGNVRWEVAGGAGRNGITFVGSRGNLILPGDRPRYFGDKFTNVGAIEVTGGNVVIDTPRNAAYGEGKNVDFTSLSFVGDSTVVSAPSQTHCTNNIFRTRTASFLPAAFTIPVVNSELILQVTDNPILAATNATLTVQANPLYENCYFARPIYLNNATLSGDYVKFGLGNAKGEGFDLYVSGTNRIAGTVPILLNGELRIHYADADAVLEIENPLCDGVVAGSIKMDGTGTLKLSGTQTFTTTLTINDGQTLECTVAEALDSSLTIANGGTLKLDVIPFTGLTNLTVQAGGTLKLPEPTYTGTYKIVDATTTTLAIDADANVYAADGTKITGEVTQGHFVLAADQLVWQTSGATWNKETDNLVWKTADGNDAAYRDNAPLKFQDIAGADPVSVLVGADVKPGFVDFRNTATYAFAAAEGLSPTITFNSLIANTPITFNVPVTVPGGIMATGSTSAFGDMVTPKVEIASGAQVEVSGTMQIPSQKMTKLRFEFSGTRTDGNRAAINELRLFNASGRFYLPVGTVITDIAGQTITVQEGTQGTEGQIVTGDVGDEKLSALVDGTLTGGNKWWASKSASPTWFEISFPTSVVAVTGYSIRTADQEARDPKDWKVYAMAEGADRYSLVATESGRTHNARRDWMLSGAEVKDRFPLAKVAGLALVRAEGKLVLNGTWCADLDLKADAILKVIGSHSFTNTDGQLYLPDTGTVKVDLAEAASSATAFPILTGFNITAAQFASFECATDTAMLLLKDGDIYAATANVMAPPYTATVSASGKWSEISFTDSKSKTFTWGSANIKSSGAVTLNVTSDSTVTLDAVGTIASLTITGSKALTINAADGVTPLAPAILDDSAHTGALVWNCPIGSTAMKAGTATTIGGGTEGTGLLIVGANKSVTLGDGVTFANREIDPTASIRFAGLREDFTLSDWEAATYSFETGILVGSFTLPDYTIKSADGDYVKLVGTNDNYYARSLLNAALTGGVVEIDSNGETTWFGQTADGTTPATTFTQSGGTFRCLATGTSPGTGLLLGYQGGTDEGSEINIKPTSGRIEVPNAFVSFLNPVNIHLLGDAVISAKGYASTATPATISLGTNTVSCSSSLEIGSLGMQAGSASITMFMGTSIIGIEGGAYLSADVYLKRLYTSDRFTFGAKEGASLALRDMSFTYYWNGTEIAMFGDSAKGLTGTVYLESESCMPKNWEVGGGIVDLGKMHANSSSTLNAKPTNGKVRVTISYEDYHSGAAIEVLHCGSWADSLSADDLRSFLTILVEDEKGDVAEVTNGKLQCSNGIVSFLPEGSAGYLFPISATVTGNANWSTLDWRDRNNVAYSNDWTGVYSAELVVTARATVTMDKSVTIGRLTTIVSSGKIFTLNASDGCTLTLTGRLDDSASAGTTVLNINVGEGMTVAAGKNLQITGAADTTTKHGTLIIAAGCTATVTDGFWNGTVEMADSTSKLLYYSTKVLPGVPSGLGKATVGSVNYSASMTPSDGDILFGSSSSAAADGTFNINGGYTISGNRFQTGIGNGTVQKFTVYGYSSAKTYIDLGDSSEDDAFVLSKDLGSKTEMWIQNNAIITATNAVLWAGEGGSVVLHLYGPIDVKGIRNNSANAAQGYVCQYDQSVITVGSKGIDFTSSSSEPFYFSGTIASSEDCTVSVSPYLSSCNGSLAPAAGTTMIVDSKIVATTRYNGAQPVTIAGSGKVILNQDVTSGGNVNLNAGTLRITSRDLLNNSPVVFNGGKMEVQIARAEAIKPGASYTMFKTDAKAEVVTANTTVYVTETGSEVSGTFKIVNGAVVFTTASVTSVKATADGVTGTWEGLEWTDTEGNPVEGIWNSTLGAAALTNTGTSDLTYSGSASVSSLRLINSGDLTIEGEGSMKVSTLNDSESIGTTRILGGIIADSITAGADTVLATVGSGTLTIAAGKCATIPGWTTLANVSGAGQVILDAGAKDNAITWGASANVTGTNIIARGTWTISNGSTYPTGREVLVKGTEAVMQITSGDATGYNGYTSSLTLEDGGTWLVDKRDTFTRPLYLVNGGHVRLLKDTNVGSQGDEGRMLDFFSKNGYASSIHVLGSAPSTIGGQSLDATSTTGSGIIAIRESNFTIDVADGSTLKVYSSWTTKDGSGGTFYKTGAGVMEQYRSAASALPFEISAGTLRLFGEGNVTTAGITNKGTLEVNVAEGATRTWTTPISGTGAFVKTGAGTLAYGEARPTYGIKVNEGKLSFTLTAAENSSKNWIEICTFADDDYDTESVEVLDGTAAAYVVDERVVDRVYSVKIDAFRMPITLNANTPMTYDWTAAPWKDASGNVSIDAADWAELLARSDLELAVTGNWNATLTVNTNITAKSLTLTGKLTLVMDGTHTFDVPITGSGTLGYTGKAECPDFADIQIDSKTISASAITNTAPWKIPEGYTLAITAGTAAPFTGDVVVSSNAALKVTMSGFATAIPVSEKTLTIDAGASVYINDVLRPAGTWEVAGGNLLLPITAPFAATVTESAAWEALPWVDAKGVAVPSGYWAQVTNAPAVTLTVNGDATLTSSAALTVGVVRVTGTGAVTLPTSDFTMGNLTGDGTVVSSGAWPSFTGLTDSANWKGTLRIANKSACAGDNVSNLGNANSVVEFDNVYGWFYGYAGCTTSPFTGQTHAYTLKIGANGFKMDNGSSSNGYTFPKLIGSGTFTFGGSTPTVRMVIKDASEFTGVIAVAANFGMTIGTPTKNPDNGTLIVASGSTVTIDPSVPWSAVNGITFASGSTLNVKADGTAEEYTIANSLTVDANATITFNGVTATRSDWTVQNGKLVKPTELKSKTVSTAESYAQLVANSAAAVSFTGDGVITTTDGLVANAAVTLDASALDGTNIAKNAVCGAPYSRWLVKGPVSGEVSVTGLPSMPVGYTVTTETLDSYGVRLIVTANYAAKLGAISLNFAGGRSTTWDSADAHVSDNAYATDKHGAQPILGSEWIDLSCQNATTTTNGLTITVSGVNNPYNTARTASPRILYGYADDSKNPLVVISGITYDKYRVILYRSTDSTGTNYSAAKIGATEADAVYYNGPTVNEETGDYTVPNTTTVAWGDSDANVLGEGVNYVVSDVLTGGTAYIYSPKHAGRAGVAAIQIVKVGELYTGPLEYEEKTLATKLSFRLPGTETKQDFDYVYHAFGDEDDHTWAETSNWATVEVHQNTDGSVITNYTMYAANTNAPALPNSAQWVPIVISGSAVNATTLEGWNGRYGLYNGAQVTVDTVKRWQSDGTQMFVAVDETSRFTIKNELSQNNSNNSINYYVAAPSGIVYQTKFANATGLAVNYYLEGNGSVCYENGFTTGTHTLKACTIELGDASLTGKAVMKKYLVVGSGTVGTNGLVVTAIAGDGGLAGTPAPTAVTADAVTAANDVGSFCVTNDSVGTYIEWVAYASGAIEVHPSETETVITATTDTNLIHVVSYYTNGTEEVKLDLTSAFVMSNVTGGVQLYLDPAGKVVVATGSGVETNSVMPVLSVITGDDHVAASPFVVEDDQVAVGVKSIPGLTYQLMRRRDASSTGSDEQVDEETAKGPRVKLVDGREDRPSDKAFYIIRVTR